METYFHFGRRTGVARQVGDVQITPESLVLLVRLGNFGHVWNWPLAVTVARTGASASAHAGPQIERKYIVDVTRITQWVLGAATLFVVLRARSGPPATQRSKRKSL
jgi:hypothetical protein